MASAIARSLARAPLAGRARSEANPMERELSTQRLTACEACHSVSRTKAASERAERRQSMLRAASPGMAGRNCQNASPVPARRRPWAPSRTEAASRSASARSGGSGALSASASDRSAAGLIGRTGDPRPGTASRRPIRRGALGLPLATTPGAVPRRSRRSSCAGGRPEASPRPSGRAPPVRRMRRSRRRSSGTRRSRRLPAPVHRSEAPSPTLGRAPPASGSRKAPARRRRLAASPPVGPRAPSARGFARRPERVRLNGRPAPPAGIFGAR